jgi:nucleoside-diphosphate-sugar epimerase
MNKVLLAGSTGFVGRELMRQLLNSNYEVIAIGKTKPEDDVEFVKLDLRDNEVLDKKLAGRKFDYLMHLASLPVDAGNGLRDD